MHPGPSTCGDFPVTGLLCFWGLAWTAHAMRTASWSGLTCQPLQIRVTDSLRTVKLTRAAVMRRAGSRRMQADHGQMLNCPGSARRRLTHAHRSCPECSRWCAQAADACKQITANLKEEQRLLVQRLAMRQQFLLTPYQARWPSQVLRLGVRGGSLGSELRGDVLALPGASASQGPGVVTCTQGSDWPAGAAPSHAPAVPAHALPGALRPSRWG